MPHTVDIHVGSRLRALRTTQGLSQSKMADRLGLSFQQVQKYECGANRISASKLFELSQILRVNPEYFFEGLAGRSSKSVTVADLKSARAAKMIENIPSQQTRDHVYALIKSLAVTETAKQRTKKRSGRAARRG